jgi:hypothetical protein
MAPTPKAQKVSAHRAPAWDERKESKIAAMAMRAGATALTRFVFI